MEKNKIISIIIPAYNRANLIGETLDSIIAQTYINWECIVVDDGSTDATKSILQSYTEKDNRFQYFQRPKSKPKGANSCRNYGLQKSNGDYAIFFDSDDLFTETCLESRLKFINRYPDYDFWVFKMQEINERGLGKICGNYFPNYNPKDYLLLFLSARIPFSICCPIWKINSYVKKEDWFDEDLLRLQDSDLHIHKLLIQKKFIIDFDSKPDTLYRVDESYKEKYSEKSFRLNIIKSYFYILKKYRNKTFSLTTQHEENKAFKEMFLYLIFHYVLPFKSFHLFNKAILFGINYNIINYKKLVRLYIFYMFDLFSLNKIRGSGYFKLRKFLFNEVI
jgi:glycosyltransferase involved in cell wall biosynthesis